MNSFKPSDLSDMLDNMRKSIDQYGPEKVIAEMYDSGHGLTTIQILDDGSVAVIELSIKVRNAD